MRRGWAFIMHTLHNDNHMTHPSQTMTYLQQLHEHWLLNHDHAFARTMLHTHRYIQHHHAFEEESCINEKIDFVDAVLSTASHLKRERGWKHSNGWQCNLVFIKVTL